ncbi:MAG: hypothetical protein R6V14_02690 [Halanaerobiales bacterium]
MLRNYHKNLQNKIIIFIILFLALLLFFPAQAFGQNTSGQSEQIIVNPYRDIDWDNINYYKANLHTHTEESDGFHSVKRVIFAYDRNDYDILAITDHNLYTWPWSDYIDNSEENELGITAINGSEISNTHHIGSYFNDYSKEAESETKVLNEIEGRNGLAVFFHPGRYQKSIDWYLNFYKKYSNLVGMEIFNKNNRYPRDIKLWDRVLFELMPYRPVWGFANDDMHSIPRDLGGHYNIFLLEENRVKKIRKGMEKGHFYIYNPVRNGRTPEFYIDNIKVDNDKIEIKIEGEYRKIEWISYDSISERNKVFAEGKIFQVSDLSYKTNYIRAKVVSRAGDIYTQPFGIVY